MPCGEGPPRRAATRASTPHLRKRWKTADLIEGYAITPKQKKLDTRVSVDVTPSPNVFFLSFHFATRLLQKMEPTPNAMESRKGRLCAIRNPSSTGGMHMRAI